MVNGILWPLPYLNVMDGHRLPSFHPLLKVQDGALDYKIGNNDCGENTQFWWLKISKDRGGKVLQPLRKLFMREEEMRKENVTGEERQKGS